MDKYNIIDKKIKISIPYEILMLNDLDIHSKLILSIFKNDQINLINEFKDLLQISDEEFEERINILQSKNYLINKLTSNIQCKD